MHPSLERLARRTRYLTCARTKALATTALTLILIAGCGSFGSTDTGDGAGARGGEGGLDGDVDGSVPLDPCINTPTDPRCLDETTALFVSVAAPAAGADGSKARPFPTLAAGLAAVNENRKRLYVCEGNYPEKVTINRPVTILGGLACDWTKAASTKTRITPPKGIALTISKSTGVVLNDLEIEGNADSQVAGDSAIAVFVSESKAVLFRRVILKAGPGVKGADGALGETNPNYTGLLAPSGVNTGTAAGAAAPVCGACNDGSISTGGAGAASAAFASQGTATPPAGGNPDNTGLSGGPTCTPGKVGVAGAAGAAAAGALKPGTLKASGWETPILAAKGVNGGPAQGGGGGGSTTTPPLGGGSGGCGGCGGTAGGPGTNGGSSFALLSFESDISLENATLTASAPGTGGSGGKGQDGQRRGVDGGGAGAGGEGGNGAGGGGGGGGASGHTAAVAHLGKAVATTDCILKAGPAADVGAGGEGGLSGTNAGMPGLPGAKGSSAEKLPL